jgi:hypothetical protein
MFTHETAQELVHKFLRNLILGGGGGEVSNSNLSAHANFG